MSNTSLAGPGFSLDSVVSGFGINEANFGSVVQVCARSSISGAVCTIGINEPNSGLALILTIGAAARKRRDGEKLGLVRRRLPTVLRRRFSAAAAWEMELPVEIAAIMRCCCGVRLVIELCSSDRILDAASVGFRGWDEEGV